MVTRNLFKKNRSRRNYDKEHTESSESVDNQNVNREHHANVKPKKGTSGKFDSQLIATAEDSIQIIPLSVRNVASDQPTLSRSSPRSTVGEDERTLLSKSDSKHSAYPDGVGVERNERTPTYTGVDYSELEEDSSIREAESCPKISGGFDASHDAQNTLIDASERVREDASSLGRIIESHDPRGERIDVQEFTSSEDCQANNPRVERMRTSRENTDQHSVDKISTERTVRNVQTVKSVSPLTMVTKGEINGVTVEAINDTGAEATIISAITAAKCKLVVRKDARQQNLCGANQVRMKCLGLAEFVIRFGQLELDCSAYVIENLHAEILLGEDFLSKHRA